MKKVLWGIIIFLILIIGGCFAIVGAGVNEIDKAITESEENSKPRNIEEGASMTIGKYTIQEGWSIGPDAMGGFEAKNVKVENTSDETDTVFFDLKVLKGSEVLANINCNTGEIEPGQVQKANCLDTGTDKFRKGWDRITVESTF